MSVVEPVPSLTFSICLSVSVLAVWTTNPPQQQLSATSYVSTTEQNEASQNGSFKHTTKMIFQAAQLESLGGRLETLHLTISYPTCIQLPFQKMLYCPLSVNMVRSRSRLSFKGSARTSPFVVMFNWHH